MEIKISYEIFKNSDEWVLHKLIEKNDYENGRGSLSRKLILKGTRKECQEEMRKMKGKKRG